MKWADPPDADRHAKGSYREEAKQLKAHPKRWAIVRTVEVIPGKDTGRSIATDIKDGKYIAFRPAGSFDAKSRKEWDEATGKKVLNIYAMYVGDPE